MTTLDPESPEFRKRYFAYIAMLRKMIKKNGWMIQGVVPSESGEGEFPGPFAYTIGLIERGANAELLMSGLSVQFTHLLLNWIAERTLEAGGIPPASIRWADDELVVGPIGDGERGLRPVWLKPLEPFAVGVACSYYQSERIPVLQYVWSDENGRFPWDLDYDIDHCPQPVGGQGRPYEVSEDER